MSDENEVSEATADEPAAVAGDDTKAAYSIHKTVTQLLGDRAGDVRNAVVKHLVDEKLEERKQMVLKGLSKLKEAKLAVTKAEKAGTVYDASGKALPSQYTKPQVDEIKKAKEAVTKLENAIEQALTNANYDKLAGLVK